MNSTEFPTSVEELELHLSEPTPRVIEVLQQLDGDVMLLGAGGKMGPTMARMARRAMDAGGVKRRVIAVSRFRTASARERLEQAGVETITCDLFDRAELERLPDSPLVMSMSGFKFGASSNPELAWATNCYLPALIGERFAKSRVVAFSSGNVYGMVPVSSGGSVETDPLRPDGEYSMTAVGRERMYVYASNRWQFPLALLRLNYATELRYGVLVDLAQQVVASNSIDVTMGYVNVLWLRDANAMSLAAFAHAAYPHVVMNVAGSEVLRMRDVCRRMGEHIGKRVEFVGVESDQALLNNGTAAYAKLGTPEMRVDTMIRWTAQWVARGGELLGKPTHFQVRNGRF